MAQPSPAGIKERIIAYMNGDRKDCLEDYLRFYNKITCTPKSAKLIDFDLDHMKIEYSDAQGNIQTSTVKIDPPMQSLADSRSKMVAMAEEATGKSFHAPESATRPLTPKTLGWTPPEFEGYVLLATTAFGVWSLGSEYPLSVRGPLARVLPGLVVEYARRYREQLFAGMIGIHLIEALITVRKCLENGAGILMLLVWSVNTLLEGYPSIKRLNKAIKKR